MLRLANATVAIFSSDEDRRRNVVVPPHIYTETLVLLREFGASGPVPRPVWILGAASQAPTGGWLERIREIDRERRAHQDTRLEAADSRDRALELFAEALAKAAPLGLVVALAPQHIDDLAGYVADVEALAAHPSLADVRWVVVDAVHGSMGSSEGWQLIVQATIEPTDRDELRHILADLAAAAVRLSPELDARLPADSTLRGSKAIELRRALAEADGRSEAGGHRDAAQLRARVQAQLEASGHARESVLVALERARALVAAGMIDNARTVFVTALREAERLDMIHVVPEAYASLGSFDVSQRRFADAAEAYSRGSSLAEARGSLGLAADTLRCAGHAYLNAERPDAAIEAWIHAFGVLGAHAPIVHTLPKPQRVVVLALALTEVFDERGDMAAASALRGHAGEVERRNPRPPEAVS